MTLSLTRHWRPHAARPAASLRAAYPVLDAFAGWWWPVGLVVLTVVLRLPGVGRPVLGNFATKAAVYGMIARNAARGEAHLLYPQLDVLVGGQPGYHLLECPLAAYLVAVLWKIFGGEIALWGRCVSIASMAVAVVAFYWLLDRWHGKRAALGGALALTVSPVALIYGQSFQLEASMLAMALMAFVGLERWLESRKLQWLLLASAGFAGASLTKIYMLYLVPVLVYRVWESQVGRGSRVEGRVPARDPGRWTLDVAVGAALLGVVPVVLWYAHAYVMASAPGVREHVYFGLPQSRQAHPWPHPLLSDPQFYRSLLDDLTSVVLTPIGLALVLLAFCRPIPGRYWVWLIMTTVLILALPRKFHEMNYYWMGTLPLWCALAGLGFERLWESIGRSRDTAQVETSSRGRQRYWWMAAAGVWLVLSLRWAAVPAFVTPPEDRAVIAAAEAVQRVSQPADRIVTLHGTSLDLLFYADRRGWTLVLPSKSSPHLDQRVRRASDNSTDPFEVLTGRIREGARYFVVVGLGSLQAQPEFCRKLERFPIVAEGSDFVVYRLADASRTASQPLQYKADIADVGFIQRGGACPAPTRTGLGVRCAKISCVLGPPPLTYPESFVSSRGSYAIAEFPARRAPSIVRP